MVRRVIALVLVLGLVPIPALAESLKAAAIREAAELVQTQTARNPNPYKTQSFVLMGGGAALLVFGLMQDRGVEVRADPFGTVASAKETGGSKTALTVLGVAIIGGGAFLYWRGEQKRQNPSITPVLRVTSKSVVLGSTLGF